MRDGVHIKSARGDIGCHKNTRATRTETIKRFGALTLRLVAVNGVGSFATRAQALGDLVGIVLGLHEHQHALDLGVLQNVAKQRELAIARNLIQKLLNLWRGAGHGVHRNAHWIVEQ